MDKSSTLIPSSGPMSLPPLPQQLSRDHHALDLVGPLHDLKNFGITHQLFHRFCRPWGQICRFRSSPFFLDLGLWVLPNTFLMILFPVWSYLAVYRPSQRTSFRLRILPSTVALFFDIRFSLPSKSQNISQVVLESYPFLEELPSIHARNLYFGMRMRLPMLRVGKPAFAVDQLAEAPRNGLPHP